jgi:glycosyltransferase involved in cell wall biosynthesis
VRIAIVIGSLGRGGSERQIVKLVRAAHPNYARVLVICLGEEGVLANEVRAVGARVVALGFNGVRMSSIGPLLRLLRVLRRERPDVVYAFLFWGYSLAVPASRLVTPSSVRVAARRSLPEYDRPAHSLLLPLRALADRFADAVVANSDAVGEGWVDANPALASKMRVIANGIEVAPEVRVRRVSGRECPTVICVANLIAYKGHQTLLEAAAVVARRTREWSLLLVGDGPERAAIEREIERLRLGDLVTVLGYRDDVDELLDEADLAVLPSYTEGLPNAVLEAMAHGLPVVATDVGGTASLVETDVGIVVPARDHTALAEALRAMLGNPERRRRAGRKGRALVDARYGVARMRDETLALFRELTRARR